MHANRNKKAVKRVEKGMMKANRIRNLFAVFAIVLTTFMITTVFSLGINYMENMKLMQVRTAGTTANASLAMPTEKQEQQIKNLEYVKTVGTQYMVGSVAEKNDEGRDLSIALSYYDPTEWEKHYKETIKDICWCVLFYGGHPFPYAFYLFCICIFMWLVVPNGLSAQPL